MVRCLSLFLMLLLAANACGQVLMAVADPAIADPDSLRPALFGSLPAEAVAAGFAPNDLSTSVRTDVIPTTRAAVVEIEGGTYDTPYDCPTTDRTYRLMGDVVFNGRGIKPTHSVTIDLNGFTLRYKQTKVEGEAVGTVVSSAGGGGTEYPALTPSGISLENNNQQWHVVEFIDGPEAGNCYDVISNDSTTLTMENQNGEITGGEDTKQWAGGGPNEGDMFRVYDPRDTFGVGTPSTTFNIQDVEIVNGWIEEGDAPGRGSSLAGNKGCNPILNSYDTTNWRVGGVAVKYHADNTSGIRLQGTGHTVEYSEVDDEGEVNTARQRSLYAIAVGEEGLVSHCRVKNHRHVGVSLGTDSVGEYNEIRGDNHAVNGPCIMVFNQDSVTIRYNNLYCTGTHPYGVGLHGHLNSTGPGGCEVYGNWSEAQTTRGSEEYGSNYAGGMSDRWGVREEPNLIHDNAFITYAANGSKARSVLIGALEGSAGEEFANNFIGSYKADAESEAHAVGGGTHNNKLVFRDCIVASNHNLVFLSDSYGHALSGRRYIGTQFLRVGDDEGFATFYAETTYWACDFDVIDCTFEGGAADDDFVGSYDSDNIVRFGHLLVVTVMDGETPVAGATVTVSDKDDTILRDGFITAENGEVVIDVPTEVRVGPDFTPATLQPLTVIAESGDLSGSDTITLSGNGTLTIAISGGGE